MLDITFLKFNTVTASSNKEAGGTNVNQTTENSESYSLNWHLHLLILLCSPIHVHFKMERHLFPA